MSRIALGKRKRPPAENGKAAAEASSASKLKRKSGETERSPKRRHFGGDNDSLTITGYPEPHFRVLSGLATNLPESVASPVIQDRTGDKHCLAPI